MKYILIESKEWFDKVNGNSYFSAQIEIDGEHVASLPIQYGYGDHYIDMAADKLMDMKLIPSGVTSFWRYCADADIKKKCIKHENCLKRDVKHFGER